MEESAVYFGEFLRVVCPVDLSVKQSKFISSIGQ